MIVFRYSEIALKGRNRHFYERILVQNLINSLVVNCGCSREKLNVYIKQQSGFIKGFDPQKINCLHEVLGMTPGIAWYGIRIKTFPLDVLKDVHFENKLMISLKELVVVRDSAVEINVIRHNKELPITSQQLWLRLRKWQHTFLQQGKYKESASNSHVQLRLNSNQTINIDKTLLHSLVVEISDRINVYARFNSVAGLPVGATGKGVVLLSGGIDSPVAAFLLALRGIDFKLLHFTPLSIEEVRNSKIYEIYKKLLIINPYTKLYVANIPFFQKIIKDNLISKLYNPMVVFKRIIAKAACLFGIKIFKGTFIVISGDSVGQVSSQTISNLIAVNKAFYEASISRNNDEDQFTDSLACLQKALFVRPLSGMNKDEIIKIARKIHTYDLSIRPYVDCCSMLAKTSKTTTNLNKIEEQDKKIGIKDIIKEVVNDVKQIE